MDIVIIGTGNTATILGKKFKAAGHQILQVYGRDSKKASELAYALDTESTNFCSVINKDADLYLIAVSDMAISEVLEGFQLLEKPIVHTAGAVPKVILKSYSSHYGVFYPLQSLRKEVAEPMDFPILYDAGDASTRQILASLARSISSTIIEADDETRLKLHMAAVFCNNFVNHIYHLVQRYCEQEGLDFHLLLPLIQETGKRLSQAPPAQMQTGPAIRKDTATLNKHLSLLETYPHLKELYELFTQSIQQYQ